MSVVDYGGSITRPLARIGAGWGRNVDLLRLGAALFILPNVLFAFGLGPIAATALLAGCALGGFVAWRGRVGTDGAFLAAPIDAPALAGCAALAIALCLLGGEGHIFYANGDWLIRDAVLADLVSHGFPIVYHRENEDFLLRAPLGMYMTPAWVGRMLGLRAAHLALLAQNAALASVVLYFAARIANTRKLPFLLLFVAFSGLDIVPVLAREAQELLRNGDVLGISHIEFWNRYWWNAFLQYSSHVTLIFWVPNHMLPGWWFATMALLYVRREVDLAALVACFPVLLMWSPLSMLGAIPFLILFGVEHLPRKIFEPRVLIAAAGGLCFVPLAIYLTIDAAAVPHRLMFAMEGFGTLYAVFLAVELPHAAILAVAWRLIDPRDRRLVALALALLVAMPIYEFGVSNDFLMRASIAPLFLFAFAFSRVAALVPRDNGRLATSISAIVILSVATPMMELHRSFAGAYAISDCNFLTSWSKADPTIWPANYLAPVEKVPAWLVPIGTERVTTKDRRCWPDHPLLDDKRK
jgi:hypothetical protein